jgi:hypothetical protein
VLITRHAIYDDRIVLPRDSKKNSNFLPQHNDPRALNCPIHADKTLIHSIANVGIVPGEVRRGGLSGGKFAGIEMCNFRTECIHNGNIGIAASLGRK